MGRLDLVLCFADASVGGLKLTATPLKLCFELIGTSFVMLGIPLIIAKLTTNFIQFIISLRQRLLKVSNANRLLIQKRVFCIY